jgi:16S rRNA C967 or C1407 C5-methylase (RsmB/RsmF family)
MAKRITALKNAEIYYREKFDAIENTFQTQMRLLKIDNENQKQMFMQLLGTFESFYMNTKTKISELEKINDCINKQDAIENEVNLLKQTKTEIYQKMSISPKSLVILLK